ncbi:MAG: tetratricopeptide repeat protein [Chloroflexi bacterium]|nr:tetratricopeptide repeat protein [Chloroflexota bacterium]
MAKLLFTLLKETRPEGEINLNKGSLRVEKRPGGTHQAALALLLAAVGFSLLSGCGGTSSSLVPSEPSPALTAVAVQPEQTALPSPSATLTPQEIEARFLGGERLLKLGRTQEALEVFQQVVAVAPLFLALEARVRLGQTQAALGKSEKAFQTYTQAALQFRQSPIAHYELGNAYLGRGDLENARLSFTTSLELDPLRADAYRSKGLVLWRLGRTAEALQDFAKAIALNPEDAEVHYYRGLLYQEQKEREAALVDFARSIALDEGFAPAYLARGLLHKEAGRIEDAVQDLEQFIELSRDEEVVAKAKAELQGLR